MSEHRPDADLLAAAAVPLVVVVVLVFSGGVALAAAALAVALVVGVLVRAWSGDDAVAVAAGGLAAVVLPTAWAALGPLGLMVILGVGWRLGPWGALVGLPFVFWDDPVAGALVAVAAASAVLLPAGRSSGPRRGVWDALALGLGLAALVGPVSTWVPLAAWAVARGIRVAEAHPAHRRLVPGVRDAAFFGAALPAAAFLFLAVVGKELDGGVVGLLVTGWALVALGLLVLPAALGLEVLMEDPDPVGRLALGILVVAALAAAVVGAGGSLRAGWATAAVGWPVVAVAAAIGIRRIGAGSVALRPWLWGGLAVVAGVAASVRFVAA